MAAAWDCGGMPAALKGAGSGFGALGAALYLSQRYRSILPRVRGNQGAAAAFAWRYPAIFVLSSIGALRCGALWVVYGFQQCGIFEQRKIQNRNALP